MDSLSGKKALGSVAGCGASRPSSAGPTADDISKIHPVRTAAEADEKPKENESTLEASLLAGVQRVKRLQANPWAKQLEKDVLHLLLLLVDEDMIVEFTNIDSSEMRERSPRQASHPQVGRPFRN